MYHMDLYIASDKGTSVVMYTHSPRAAVVCETHGRRGTKYIGGRLLDFLSGLHHWLLM